MISRKSIDTDLGINRPITRRDFLDGVLIGCGSLLLGPSLPLHAATDSSLPPIGDYSTSNGNTDRVVADGHLIRDGRAATLSQNALNTQEVYDLVVIGGGFSGLSSAYYYTKETRNRKTCLILENHDIFGGAAKRNEFTVNGQRLMGPQGSNSFVPLTQTEQPGSALYEELGVPANFAYQPIQDEIRALDFDRTNFGFMHWFDSSSIGHYFGKKQPSDNPWAGGIWNARLTNTPLSNEVKMQLLKWRMEKRVDPKGHDTLQWLDTMSYKEYLEQIVGVGENVIKYADPIVAAALGWGCDAISAYAAAQIGMAGFSTSQPPKSLRQSTWHSFPGGNDGLIRYLVKALIPAVFEGRNSLRDIHNQPVRFGVLDLPTNPVRLRLGATALRVEQSDKQVKVSYLQKGKTYSVRTRHVVVASGGWLARRIVGGLPDAYNAAFSQMHRAPFLVANVALTNWHFLAKLGFTACRWFEGFGFSCNLRQQMTIGEYSPPLVPDKPAVLTFYIPLIHPGLSAQEQGKKGRAEMMATSFLDYERKIREQMVRLFVDAGFNPRSDIAGITLNRWGHAFVNPYPGFYFGQAGSRPPRDIIRMPLGHVAFANAELNGHQHWVGAVDEGKRAAEQVLNL